MEFWSQVDSELEQHQPWVLFVDEGKPEPTHVSIANV